MAADTPLILHVGAVGWMHDSWRSCFYPDDLPGEWQLAYYANEFSVLLAPARVIADAGAEKLQAWFDDLPRRFRILLRGEPEEILAAERVTTAAAALRGHISGFVFRTIPNEALLNQLQSPLSADFVLAVERASAADFPGADQVLARLPTCWSPDLASSPQQRVAAVGLLAPPTDKPTLGELREYVELFRSACAGATEGFLFFDGSPPNVETMRNTVTIAGLLGLL